MPGTARLDRAVRVLKILLVTFAAAVVFVVGAATTLLMVLDDDDYRGIAAYLVKRQTGRTMVVDGKFAFRPSLEPSLTMSDVRLDNPSWASQKDLARIGHLEIQVALKRLLSGTLLIERLVLEDANFELETGADGVSNWAPAGGQEETGDDKDGGFLVPVLGTVMLRNVDWHYRDDASGRDTSIKLAHLTMEDVAGVGRLDGEGVWNGQKIRAKGEFGTLAEALHPTKPFPIDLSMSLPGLELVLHGTVAEPALGHGVDLRLTGHSNDVSELLGLLGSDLPIAGRLDSEAKLSGDLAALQVADLSLSLVDDKSQESKPSVDITGQIETVRPGGAMPVEGIDLKVQIATSTATLSSWLKRKMPDLGPVDGQFALTGSAKALKVSGAHVQIGNAAQLTIAAAGDVEAIQLTPNLMVQGVDVHLEAKAPTTAALAKPLDFSLPELGAASASAHLSGGLDQLDLKDVDLHAGTTDRPIQVNGQIDNLLGKAPATATFEGALAPLLGGLLDKQLPELGRVHASAQLADVGGSPRVERLQIVADDTDVLSVKVESITTHAGKGIWPELDVQLAAKDLTILGTLLDLSIPPLGPFSYSGRLAGEPETPRLSGKARLGQTEIEENLTASFSGARPRVSGKLSTPVLYLADLGLRPDGPRQEGEADAAATSAQAEGGSLPFAALQTLDLSLMVRADQVEGVKLSVDRASLDVTLQDGVLEIDGARFDLVEGSAKIHGIVDSRSDPPEITISAIANDVRIGHVLAQLEEEAPIEGELDLLLDLKSAGTSEADLLSSLTGEFGLAIERGKIYVKYFDLTGTDLVHWLFAGAAKRRHTDLHCLLGRLDIKDGVMTTESLLMETSLVISHGSGDVDLVEETVDVLVHPKPRKAELVELTTPYRIIGPLSKPAVEYSKARLAARAAEEVVLSPINALDALVPLINDNGKDKDNPCLKWVASVQTAASGFAVEDLAPAAYVAQTASHVRKGPGTSYAVIETLAKGATVEVTGKAQALSWYRVSLADGGLGYVWGRLLEPAEPPNAQ